MKITKNKIIEIQKLCKNNKVKSLFAFGSVTRDDFKENSDIDLIIDINEDDPFKYTDIYFYLKLNFEKLLNRPIDLLEKRALKNKIFINEVENTKVKIYEH
jgi:predicted nucleotidyltransferase